jgi:hypothetical protein
LTTTPESDASEEATHPVDLRSYAALHGHYLDHLAVIEPWTAELRRTDAAR